MISLSLIRPFCSADPDRGGMAEVRLEAADATVVATNGRVLVSLAGAELDPEELAELEADRPGYFPDWRLVVADNWTEEVQVAPPELFGDWADYVYSDFCVECEGTGVFDCFCPSCRLRRHDCGVCSGTGRVEVWRDWEAVFSWGGRACGHYVYQVNRLPSVRWFLPPDPERVISFRFGETGRGLLMPLRRERSAKG